MSYDRPASSLALGPRILVANGVNLDLLGRREPTIYGSAGLEALEALLRSHADELAHIGGWPSCHLSFYQSNNEAEFLTELSQPWDGALINPGAWTHTSLALGDRLAALGLPFVEVHLSKLAVRESFRQYSYCASHALGVVEGLGLDSYLVALLALLRKLPRVSPGQSDLSSLNIGV